MTCFLSLSSVSMFSMNSTGKNSSLANASKPSCGGGGGGGGRPHSLAHDCPNHRLRVETVAQGQAALRRLFEESVEESKGMLIQRRLVRALLWLVVSGTVVGIAECFVIWNGGYRSTSNPINRTDTTVRRVPVPLICDGGNRSLKARTRSVTEMSPSAQSALSAFNAFFRGLTEPVTELRLLNGKDEVVCEASLQQQVSPVVSSS